jgi:hypothetical protein
MQVIFMTAHSAFSLRRSHALQHSSERWAANPSDVINQQFAPHRKKVSAELPRCGGSIPISSGAN